MPAAIVMPGFFMPVGIACAPHLLPYRRVDAGRHSYAWFVFLPVGIACAPHLLPYRRVYAGRHTYAWFVSAGHHSIVFVQNDNGIAIEPLVTPARLSKMQADFTTQLANKLGRLLNNLNDVWAFWVAPSCRDEPDEGDPDDSRWGRKEDKTEEGVKTRLGGFSVNPAAARWLDMDTGQGTVNLDESGTDRFSNLLLFVEDMLYTTDPRDNELDQDNGVTPGFPAPMDRVRLPCRHVDAGLHKIPGVFMPVGIACASHSLPCRHVADMLMPVAIVMPGVFMPVGIACAPYSFPCRHVDAGRHNYAWCVYAGRHSLRSSLISMQTCLCRPA